MEESNNLGVYMVFNPNKNKPTVVYKNYTDAANECKRIAEKEKETVYVLKVVGEAEVRKIIVMKEEL